MQDIQFIRNNPIEFDNLINKRGLKPISKKILEIDSEKRKSQSVLQKLQEKRNEISKEIGLLKSQKKDVNSKIDDFLCSCENLISQAVTSVESPKDFKKVAEILNKNAVHFDELGTISQKELYINDKTKVTIDELSTSYKSWLNNYMSK